MEATGLRAQELNEPLSIGGRVRGTEARGGEACATAAAVAFGRAAWRGAGLLTSPNILWRLPSPDLNAPIKVPTPTLLFLSL